MRDQDVRSAVLRWLDKIHAGDDNTRVVEEMGVWAGSVRVDIAVINGELCGFELKSARDTLERLPKQVSLYSEVFDRMTLVVAEKHIAKAVQIIPTWWGISAASGDANIGLRLEQARPACVNPELRPLQIARLLWRSEAIAILERHNLVRGCRSKSADVLAQRLASELALDELRLEVRSALKARVNWLGQVVTNKRDMTIQP